VSPEFFIGLALTLVLAASCRTGGGAGAALKFFPPDGAVPDWTIKGEPQVFVGRDLFTYIDGGADIYLEYVFRQVLVRDYAGPNGKTISVEVYEMTDPAAAFGMYEFKKGAKGRAVGSEGRGQLEDYYLNFWKGRYLITLTGFDADGDTLAGLEALARAADARIKDGGEPAAFLASLPAENRIKPSLSYFRGPLGLNAVFPKISLDVAGFKEGAAADYDTGLSVVVLRYADAPACRAGFERLRAALATPARFFEFQDLKDGLAAASDEKGRSHYAAPRGLLLWIVSGRSPRTIRSFLDGLGASPRRGGSK